MSVFAIKRNEATLAALIERNISISVAWYLMAAYAYYHLDDPILEDGTYDALARLMLLNWEDINHRHKHLIDKEALEAGTLLLPKEKFPQIIIDTAVSLSK